MTVETPDRHTEIPSSVQSSAHGRKEQDAGLAKLDVSKLTIKLTDAPKPLPVLETLKFGTTFSDHMVFASFHPASGWSAPEIKPYGPISLDPSSSCFQYGGNVFEGFKAYLGSDGKPRLFRAHMNMRRLERSMGRLALPPVDGDAVLELIKRLVQIDKRWIPAIPGYSLYIRPTVIGTRPALGVGASDHAVLCVITSPVGAYFPRPVSLLAVNDAVRAWPGGIGAYKFAGNYSPTFQPQREAAAKGYDQVLWVFGEERRLTEAGAMNVFVVVKRADGNGLDVVTPQLDGLILPGVTRTSCLELVADPAFQASIVGAEMGTGTKLHPAERTVTLFDLERWSAAGDLLEVILVGTAVIVGATHNIGFEGRVVVRVPTYPTDPNGLGPVGRALRAKILAIQDGREEYKEWAIVCE